MVSWYRIFVGVNLFAAALVVYTLWSLFGHQFTKVPETPKVERRWFGKGRLDTPVNTSINPFKIHVDEKVITDLKSRIDWDLKRIVDPLENSLFLYGFNSVYLRQVARYWRDEYDWRQTEKLLNQIPQFTTKIDGIEVHFLHARPSVQDVKRKKVLPLLLVHGWPGSIMEFMKIIPMLTASRPDQDFVFEVIAPSIPGFGFSSAPAQRGFSSSQCARIFRELMQERLGFKTFYTQGGDWGSLITTRMANLYPNTVRGAHLNMAIASTTSANVRTLLAAILPPWMVVDEEEAKLMPPGFQGLVDLILETGYLHIQATKPDTVGVALSTSPVGLAAYILEKFSTWTSKSHRYYDDGKLTEKFSLDELLDNVMLYWVTNSITSSMRFYKESFALFNDEILLNGVPITTPVGIANFWEDLFTQPRSSLETKFKNIKLFTNFRKVGHFPALEKPELLSDHVRQFVQLIEADRANSESKSKSKLKPESKPKSEQKSKVKSEPESKPKLKPESKSKSEPESNPKPEPKSPKSEPESKSKPKLEL